MPVRAQLQTGPVGPCDKHEPAHGAHTVAGRGRDRQAPPTPAPVSQLGNHVVSTLLAGGTGAADAPARNPLPPIQRKCSCGGKGHGGAPCPACAAKAASGKRHGDGHAEVAVIPEAVRRALVSPGRPVPDSVVRALPQALTRAGPVRIVADRTGDDAARALGSEAFASNGRIVFRADAFRPETPDGRALIAHELEHLRQQRSGRVARGIEPPGSPNEQAARRAERGETDHPETRTAPVAAIARDGPESEGGSATIYVECTSATSGTITFVTPQGTFPYDLNACDFTPGASFNASVSVSTAKVRGDRLNITITDNVPEGQSASFSYTVRDGEPHPGSLMEGVTTARLIGGPAPLSLPGLGGGPLPFEQLAEGESVHFEVRQLSPEEFERTFGIDAESVPEGSISDLGSLIAGATPEEDPGSFPLSALAPGVGAGAFNAPVPDVFTVPAPPNSTGIIWSRFSHVMAFGNPPEGATVRGYRYSVPQEVPIEIARGARRIPGLGNYEPLVRTSRLPNFGVPGRTFTEYFYMMNPFGQAANQVILSNPTTAGQATAFSSQLRGLNESGVYRYPPPPEGTTAHTDLFPEGVRPETWCRANNCITVFSDVNRAALGGRSFVVEIPNTEAFPVHMRGLTVDVATGLTPEGVYVPEAHGSGPLMEQALGLRPGPGEEGLSAPELFSARQKSFANEGLTLDVVPRRFQVANAIGVGAIRAGGVILLVYGAYKTAERVSEAVGTPRLGRVVAQETGAWVGGVIAGALGSAGAAALVCAPTGPVTFGCAAAGFAGGLIVGAFGGYVGYHAGDTAYDLAGDAVDAVIDNMDPQSQRDARAFVNGLGGDTESSIYFINRLYQAMGGY